MKLVYFAWVRQEVGLEEETLSIPPALTTVQDIIAHLHARGGGYAKAFADPTKLRMAVNQRFVEADHPVQESDEVAFFPPVTGG